MSGNSISFDLDQSHGDLLSSAHRWSPISIGGISRLSGASTSRGNISLSPLEALLCQRAPKEASGKTPRKGKRGRKPKAKKQPTEQEVNKKNKKKKPKVEKTKRKSTKSM